MIILPCFLLFLPLIEEASIVHQVPKALILAIIHKESHFKPNAVSPGGHYGLMQLASRHKVRDPNGNPTEDWVESSFKKEAKLLHVRGLLDPRTNIFVGTRHLARLMKKFDGDLPRVIYAYNASKIYVRDVLELYKNYLASSGENI